MRPIKTIVKTFRCSQEQLERFKTLKGFRWKYTMSEIIILALEELLKVSDAEKLPFKDDEPPVIHKIGRSTANGGIPKRNTRSVDPRRKRPGAKKATATRAKKKK